MAANRSIHETLATGSLVAITLAIVGVDPTLAYAGGGMMGGGTAGGMTGFGFFGLLWPLLLLGGLIALVYRAADSGNDGRSDGSDRALDALRSRYARGELTDEAFEERRRRLER